MYARSATASAPLEQSSSSARRDDSILGIAPARSLRPLRYSAFCKIDYAAMGYSFLKRRAKSRDPCFFLLRPLSVEVLFPGYTVAAMPADQQPAVQPSDGTEAATQRLQKQSFAPDQLFGDWWSMAAWTADNMSVISSPSSRAPAVLRWPATGGLLTFPSKSQLNSIMEIIIMNILL